MIRLGIIGLGWVARDYALPAIAEVAGLHLAAVADPHAKTIPEGVEGFGDARDLLDAQICDAVYVASPNHLHEEHVVAALSSGHHVLCEKPLALSGAAAERMARAAEEHRRVLVTAFDQRHHPAHKTMQALIASGRIGRLTQIRIDYACWVGSDFAADNWRIEPEKAGGGAVMDLAPHGLDLAEFLSGEPLRALKVLRQSRIHDYAVDDGGVLCGRGEDGLLLNLTVAYNRNEALPRRRLEVFGEQGALLATDTMGQVAGGKLILAQAAEGETELHVESTPPFTEQFRAFTEAVRSGKPARDPQRDVSLVRLLDDALREDEPWR